MKKDVINISVFFRGTKGKERKIKNQSVLDTVKRCKITLHDLITESEEFLCYKFIETTLKNQDNYHRRKKEKLEKEVSQFLTINTTNAGVNL